MAKWYGVIGYAESKETSPGVWKDGIVKRNYFGDLTRNSRRLQSSDKVNDNIEINNELSIISDPYANENFHMIRYVELMGTRWKVSNVEVKYPRLILTLGGIYNGK